MYTFTPFFNLPVIHNFSMFNTRLRKPEFFPFALNPSLIKN